LWPGTGERDVATWIAEVDGRPVGYLISYEKKLDGRRVWYVGGVGVLKSYRHTGIGRRLMQAVFADHPMLWLHVRASNRAALHLYAKLDMRELRRLKRFYSNGEDAVVMVTPDLA
jgi:ribosomal-protein-alanine N-acetyltransferase